MCRVLAQCTGEASCHIYAKNPSRERLAQWIPSRIGSSISISPNSPAHARCDSARPPFRNTATSKHRHVKTPPRQNTRNAESRGYLLADEVSSHLTC